MTLVAIPRANASDPREDAKQHFVKGTKNFDLGLYDAAIREYMEAYQIIDDPALLYNLAQAHRLAGHPADAIRFYRTFLAKVGTSGSRREVEAKIAELQRLVDQQNKAQHLPPNETIHSSIETTPSPPTTAAPEPVTTTPIAPPPATTTTAETPPVVAPSPTEPVVAPVHHGLNGKTSAAIALAAVGVAAIVGGGVATSFTLSANDKVVSTANSSGKFDPSVEKSGQTAQSASIALYAVGGAALVTSGVLFILGHREQARLNRAQVTPVVGPSTVGMSLSMRF